MLRCLWLNQKKYRGRPGPVKCWQKGKRINKKECRSCLLAIIASGQSYHWAPRRPPKPEGD